MVIKMKYVICLQNEGYEASLEVRKLYQVIEDEKASASHFLRIIDESGEDYIYPEDFFINIDLPHSIEQAIEVRK